MEQSAKPEVWNELIRSSTVNDLIKHKKGLITIPANATLRESLRTLESNNIISAPIVENHNVLGFVDVLDIAGYILHAWRNHSMFLEHLPHGNKNYRENPFFDVPVSELLNYSRMDPIVTVKTSASIKDLMEIFTQPRHLNRLHRVAVVDDNNRIFQVVTQSDIIAFAAANSHLMPRDKITLPVKDLSILHSVVMVRVDSSFSDALELLYNNRIGGIALVDDQGRIIGNFSASDLRGLKEDAFDYFNGSTLQFLTKGTRGGLYAPISLSEKNSLEDVMKKMVEKKIHRMYITSDSDYPRGVITMGDIIQVLRWKVNQPVQTNIKITPH